jgi:hypothetical protein
MTPHFRASARPWRPTGLTLLSAVAAVTLFVRPAEAQRESERPVEVQLGVIAATGALGTADGYHVRLQGAPTLAVIWTWRGSDRIHARGVVEATPYLWGRASPTSGCVGYCQPTGFTVLGASAGADLVLTAARGQRVSSYFAAGPRARAYFLATASCPTVPGAFCPGGDPLTDATIRPALAFAGGVTRRDGASGVSIEVGYLPTWVGGRVRHDLRLAVGRRL